MNMHKGLILIKLKNSTRPCIRTCATQCRTLSVLPSTSICSGGALSTNFFIVIFMDSCAFFKFYKEAHVLDHQATARRNGVMGKCI